MDSRGLYLYRHSFRARTDRQTHKLRYTTESPTHATTTAAGVDSYFRIHRVKYLGQSHFVRNSSCGQGVTNYCILAYRSTDLYRPHTTRQLTLTLTLTPMILTNPRSLTLNPHLSLFSHKLYAWCNRKYK